MSAIQYLNFIANAFNLSESERKEKIEYYANLLDLKTKLGDKISTYSHGMKQKLVIIGALIHSPKLLVLDEPFVCLVPESSFKPLILHLTPFASLGCL